MTGVELVEARGLAIALPQAATATLVDSAY